MTPWLLPWTLVGVSAIHRDGDAHTGWFRGRWGISAEFEAGEVPWATV